MDRKQSYSPKWMRQFIPYLGPQIVRRTRRTGPRIVDGGSRSFTLVAPTAGKSQIIFATTAACDRYDVFYFDSDVARVKATGPEYVHEFRQLKFNPCLLLKKPINCDLAEMKSAHPTSRITRSIIDERTLLFQ
jgi:hypothetical protein